jgi:hypothetical protein
MRAFRIYLNNEELCVAGIDGDCVLTAIVNYVTGHNGADMFLHVGGLRSSTREHVRWIEQKSLQVDDEIRVKIIDTASIDAPNKEYQADVARRLAERKRYVRRMAKELGWKIQTRTK